MAKFDFKKLVNDSADKLKTGAQKAQEAVKEFDIRTAAGDVMTKGKDAAEYFKQKTDEHQHNTCGDQQQNTVSCGGIARLFFFPPQ